VLPDRSNLPLDFSYEEGDPPVERLHFTVWDRYRFVRAHEEHYHHRMARSRLNRQIEQFSEARNLLFLECVKVERLADTAPPEEWWFTDLLKRNMLAQGPRHGTPEEIAARQAWLRAWGYGEEGDDTPTAPFMSHTAGLLCWADRTNYGSSSDGLFLSGAQEKAQGVLIPVESLYAASLLGLLALDVLTSTGMRMNELLQMSISRKCLVQLVEDPPLHAADQSPRLRYLFRLIPKGERTLTLHNYAVGKETIQLVEKVCHMRSRALPTATRGTPSSCSFCSRRWQKPSVRASSVPLSVFLSAFKWDHDHSLPALFAAWYDPDRKRWQTGHD